MTKPVGDILVGTASWTDPSLVKSGWYPKGTNTAEDRLRYYGEHFPLVEVDSTYYFPPTRENAVRWAERTPPEFVFNIKAFSLLTQHPTSVGALWEDLRPSTDKKNVYAKDLPPATIDAAWDRFLDALEPLFVAEKLGTVLFQFPPWFVLNRANKQYVLECARRVAPLRPCIEFRHESWLSAQNVDETIDFLTGHALPFVCVDMPQGFRSSVPPVVAVTADLAVVRFHGHNDAEWESKSVQRRFAYKYSRVELEQWVPKVQQMAEQAEQVHVLMNNCHSDHAQVNATELAALLTQTQ